MSKILAIVLLAFIVSTATAQLTGPEKKSIVYVDEHMDDAMKLLIESVNINSGTLNISATPYDAAHYLHLFRHFCIDRLR